MGRKQRLGPEIFRVGHIFQHRARNRHTVKRRGAASDLVENQQAVFGRGAQDRGGLAHLDHKRRFACRQLVRGADSRKNLIDEPDSRRSGRHKAADVREDNDQRDLTHIGGFARHIRAGDDRKPVILAVERRVVGHEHRILAERFDDGVTAVFDLNFAGEIDVRPRIVVQRRRFGHRQIGVQPGDCGGGAHDPRAFRLDFVAQSAEQLIFQGADAVVGLQDRRFQLFQRRGDIALAVRYRLFSDVFRRDLLGIQLRHLDIIAEDAVIADFQRF